MRKTLLLVATILGALAVLAGLLGQPSIAGLIAGGLLLALLLLPWINSTAGRGSDGSSL